MYGWKVSNWLEQRKIEMPTSLAARNCLIPISFERIKTISQLGCNCIQKGSIDWMEGILKWRILEKTFLKLFHFYNISSVDFKNLWRIIFRKLWKMKWLVCLVYNFTDIFMLTQSVCSWCKVLHIFSVIVITSTKIWPSLACCHLASCMYLWIFVSAPTDPQPQPDAGSGRGFVKMKSPTLGIPTHHFNLLLFLICVNSFSVYRKD